jgi:hypothetical protein
MNAYSEDLPKKVVEAAEWGCLRGRPLSSSALSCEEVAGKRFNVCSGHEKGIKSFSRGIINVGRSTFLGGCF